MKTKFYLTTPIYYASGFPHIGHAFTTIYADVLARYKKKQGFDVFFSTGMDEHGTKIFKKARENNVQPQEFVDKIAQEYLRVWKLLEIEYDSFIRTTSPRHIKGVNVFLQRIYAKGDVYKHKYQGYYCNDCESFISPAKLLPGKKCPIHLKPVEKIEEENYFFNLKKYLPSIRQKILTDEIEIIPEQRKKETLSIIDSGIENFSITREKVKWGIPCPFDKTQNIYVWVEALINYLTVLDYPDGDNFKKFWPADLHIIGADINKFHTIFWPALLMSAELSLPKKIFIHGFFTINGQKMGKAQGNVIDPCKMIEQFGCEGVRYLLLTQFPAHSHGDIKQSQFKNKYNSDLANGIGNLTERIFGLTLRITNPPLRITNSYEFTNFERKYRQFMEKLDVFEAINASLSLAKFLDGYINETKVWKISCEDKKLKEILGNLIFGLSILCSQLEPVLPSKMKILQQRINSNNFSKIGLFPRK